MPLKVHMSTDGESKAQENYVEGGLIESEWSILYQWHFLYLPTIKLFYIPKNYPDSEEGKIISIAFLLHNFLPTAFLCSSTHWLQRKYTGSIIKLVWVVNRAIVPCNGDSQLLKAFLKVDMIHTFWVKLVTMLVLMGVLTESSTTSFGVGINFSKN